MPIVEMILILNLLRISIIFNIDLKLIYLVDLYTLLSYYYGLYIFNFN